VKRDNKIVVDLNKVQHAKFGYRNQYGQFSDKKKISVRGDQFDPNVYHVSGISMIIFASESGLIDMWRPVVILKLTANESLEYSGDRAVSIYKEWCSRVFKKKK